jgi:uncharacterized coiled-coil protein SlyX
MPETQEQGSQLDKRVDRLEHSVGVLRDTTAELSGAVGQIGQQVSLLGDTLGDIGNKLDDQRTRRPELGSLATLGLVLIAIGGLAFAPVMSRMNRMEIDMRQEHTKIEQELTATQHRLEDRLNNYIDAR